jgi:hypothetical protein
MRLTVHVVWIQKQVAHTEFWSFLWKTFWSPKPGYKDNIEINHKYTECGYVRWINASGAEHLSGFSFWENSQEHWTVIHLVAFEVLSAASMKMAVFWVVVPCSLIEVYRRFRGTCCLHHQRWRQKLPLKRRKTSTRLHGAITQKTAIFVIHLLWIFKKRTSFQEKEFRSDLYPKHEYCVT